jgi:hypothetical protein
VCPKCNPYNIFSILGKYKRLHKQLTGENSDEVIANASWNAAGGGRCADVKGSGS